MRDPEAASCSLDVLMELQSWQRLPAAMFAGRVEYAGACAETFNRWLMFDAIVGLVAK